MPAVPLDIEGGGGDLLVGLLQQRVLLTQPPHAEVQILEYFSMKSSFFLLYRTF